MAWRLAHVSRDGDDYVVTLSDDPSIIGRSQRLEEALERVKLSLGDRTRGRRRRAPSRETSLADAKFDGPIVLIEMPDDAHNMLATGALAARRRSARLARAQDARVQTGSLLARSRIRKTTSP